MQSCEWCSDDEVHSKRREKSDKKISASCAWHLLTPSLALWDGVCSSETFRVLRCSLFRRLFAALTALCTYCKQRRRTPKFSCNFTRLVSLSLFMYGVLYVHTVQTSATPMLSWAISLISLIVLSVTMSSGLQRFLLVTFVWTAVARNWGQEV